MKSNVKEKLPLQLNLSTPALLKLFQEISRWIFIFYDFWSLWYDTGTWNPSSWRQGHIDVIYSMPWLLMSWQHMEPGHQQYDIYLPLPEYSCFNTLRLRQNSRHFADDTLKHIFFNENVKILLKVSLKLVPRGPINNIPSLVQIMAWRLPGNKPLSEPNDG